MRRIGFKNLHYAKLTADSSGKPTYGEVVKIPKCINIKTSDEYGEYTFYSEDTVEESGKKLVKSEIEIEVGYITNKLKADLTGIRYDAASGKTYKGTTSNQPIVAILYEMPRSDGESDYRVLYKCTFAIEESEAKTIEDGVESSNFILKGVAVPLATTGDVDMEISSDDTAEGANDIITNFFKAVQV